MRAAPIEFSAPGGPVLRGQSWGQGEGCAVLVHDEGRDLDGWQPLVGDLCDLGLRVLAFDLRGHGASDDPWDPAGAVADVLAALDFAGAPRLYLLGAGAGATAALAAAARDERVLAVVALSPRAGEAGAEEARAPKLIVVGRGDEDAAAAAEDVYRRALGWAVLDGPPVAEQGTDLLASEWGEHVAEHVLVFLRDYL